MSTGQVIFDIVVGVLSLYSAILSTIHRRTLNQRRHILTHYGRRRQVSDD